MGSSSGGTFAYADEATVTADVAGTVSSISVAEGGQVSRGQTILQLTSDTNLVEDLKGNSLLLFTSPWNITYATDHNEGLRLAEFSENA